ncbi:hypothetical protein ACFWOL_10820 [Streptomyces sp. NPDC058442]|uniref:hypothetical protein n=1 Tax=Streptomyces sp. NPDC058442 TaxID=3346503 RepID=UPI0036696702
MNEAVNSVLKVEYVPRHSFRTRTEARVKIATWITDFCNARRLHSVCGFKSPIDCEREYRATLAEGLAAWVVSTLRGDRPLHSSLHRIVFSDGTGLWERSIRARLGP